MMKPVSPGGWRAIEYSIRMAREVGWLNLWRGMRSANACKTCALGMGGQKGGMRNEAGRFPEFCKKSLQAMASDMQGVLKEDFFRRVSLKKLKTLSSKDLEYAGRLSFPVYAGPNDTHYRRISWDEALSKMARALKDTPPIKSFFYFSGRSSNEAGFLLQILARVYGTNHVNNCSYYCHQPSGVGLTQALGSATATLTLEDLEHSDLVFLIGTNPASNHPRLMTSLMHLKRRGGKVIAVNPVRERGLIRFHVPSDLRSLFFGTPITDIFIQPHIGGDIAFLTGIGKYLLESNAVTGDFIATATEGWSEYRAVLKKTTWETLTAESGVSRRDRNARDLPR